jgi:hypothetical protein
MTRVLAAAATAALMAATSPASAQIDVRGSTSAETQSQESVVVQGQRREIAQALRKLIAPADNEQLARFEDEICPMVIGMPRDWTASLTRLIRDNVVAVGGKIGKPGCKVNAAVIFIDQPLDLIKAFAEAEPGYFNMTPREFEHFAAVPKPVASWHVTDMRGRDGRSWARWLLGMFPTDAKIARDIPSAGSIQTSAKTCWSASSSLTGSRRRARACAS